MRHQIDDQTLEELKKIPLHGLFYRVGNFELRDTRPYLERIKKQESFVQDFKKLTFPEIHTVYTFENSSNQGFVRGYMNRPKSQGVDFVARNMVEDYEYLRAINPSVVGIQIDLEGPGVDFSVYLELIKRVKVLAPSAKISITPMSSWHKRPEFLPVAKASDLIVPMFYDFHRGKKVEDPLKVTDIPWLKRIVSEWDQLKVPLLIGLPTYSYCVLYDHHGNQAVPWAVTSPESISDNPVWKLISDNPQSNDRVLLWRAQKDFSFQRQPFKKGSSMKYNFVSSSSLSAYLESINSLPLKHSHGVAFFRLGYLNEPLVLDALRIRRSIANEPLPKLKIEVTRISVSNKDFFLVFSNQGEPTWFGGEGLRVRIKKSRLLGSSSDFDHIKTDEDEQLSELVEEYFDSGETLVTPRIKEGKDDLDIRVHLLDGKVRIFNLKAQDLQKESVLLESD
ncbi:MAG: hypothetical protein H3C47_15120 [Candidatus Cloacimonetes bacterium]|nr:hypothetical protein [Candidatus Cloacimonadota bacterium]